MTLHVVLHPDVKCCGRKKTENTLCGKRLFTGYTVKASRLTAQQEKPLVQEVGFVITHKQTKKKQKKECEWIKSCLEIINMMCDEF